MIIPFNEINGISVSFVVNLGVFAPLQGPLKTKTCSVSIVIRASDETTCCHFDNLI